MNVIRLDDRRPPPPPPHVALTIVAAAHGLPPERLRALEQYPADLCVFLVEALTAYGTQLARRPELRRATNPTGGHFNVPA